MGMFAHYIYFNGDLIITFKSFFSRLKAQIYTFLVFSARFVAFFLAFHFILVEKLCLTLVFEL
jgi:hypothetical protein